MIEITAANNPFKIKGNCKDDLDIVGFHLDKASLIFNDRIERNIMRFNYDQWVKLRDNVETYKRLVFNLKSKKTLNTIFSTEQFRIHEDIEIPRTIGEFFRPRALTDLKPTTFGYISLDLYDFTEAMRLSGLTVPYSKSSASKFQFTPVESWAYWNSLATSLKNISSDLLKLAGERYKDNALKCLELTQALTYVDRETTETLSYISKVKKGRIKEQLLDETIYLLQCRTKDTGKIITRRIEHLYNDSFADNSNITRKDIISNILDLLTDPGLTKQNLNKSILNIKEYRESAKKKRPSVDRFEKALIDLFEHIEK